ncbi:apical junction component 1 homolog, partial [Agrilus planipennis]|uniref:Apical junction component 1 homolog n=1 Tax=Agrilus planipennis TaxID=224129 RepID=A0A1W4WV27_AGRPL
LEVTAVHYSYSREQRPSPNSTTLEDVLDSLLGLPPSTRAPSPSLAETASVNTSPGRLGEESRAAEQYRRHSEGSDTVSQKPQHSTFQRRISFDSTPLIRCRYNRCGKTIPVTSSEARDFKNCHNCSYTYCSRQCRRAHWEKHRKICLFSRIGSLCRQVLTSVKENADSLLQISLVARRGYLAKGPGAVKCFFPCPENAEKFLVEGLPALGDLTYVARADLLPSEMGSQMYSEIMKMCKNYNPDSKLVLYVSVCVVSEAPTAGSVKWERQLVSRCAKMRLSKNVPLPGRDVDIPETYIFTCVPTFDEKMREEIVNRLANELGLLGVNLQRKYPEIHGQLQSFASRNFERFTPITVYPYVEQTGKCFMCIIMLDAEPDSVRQVAAAGIQARTINLR